MMNRFGSISRESNRSEPAPVRSRSSSQFLRENERYTQGRSTNGRLDMNRDSRRQSREGFFESGGEGFNRNRGFDRFSQERHGNVHGENYGCDDDRFYQRGSFYGEYRYDEPARPQREMMRSRPDDFEMQPRYSFDRRHSMDDIDRCESEMPRRPFDNRRAYEFSDYEREPYFNERSMYGSRYGLDRSEYVDRANFEQDNSGRRYFKSRFDIMGRDQSDKPRFDRRRSSVSDGGEIAGRSIVRSTEKFRRAQSVPNRRSRDDLSTARQERFGSPKPRQDYERDGRMSEFRRDSQFRRGSSQGSQQVARIGNRELAVNTTYDILRRRHFENSRDSMVVPTWLQRGGSCFNEGNVSDDTLRVDKVDFCVKDNSEKHRTFEYEMVTDAKSPNPVFRRGKTFQMDICLKDRNFDPVRDIMHLNFYFGSNPSVPKQTRVVLPVGTEDDFSRVPFQWDARITNQKEKIMSLEVNIPATSPVGMWRCIIETSGKESQPSCVQYCCPEDIYIIFNPFEPDDAVFMENDEQRYEYVINDTGKVYTGGYRNIRGRPWVFGQFDDCVLPAACALLEMSGLPHTARGNPLKVAEALASMIKSQRSVIRGYSRDYSGSGLIEFKYGDNFVGSFNPHLWSGSVQIIEEFLRSGSTPVKYGQCWIMAALMTTLCRCLGLPSRPVTAFLYAMDTQNSQTIDRYIDRFGDIMEYAPGREQPDSLWTFHTWCDIWMHRPDLAEEYSGWQATDGCRVTRDSKNQPCGPCPVEALRQGEVGQKEDVDQFYASLNSYVRYFYEDNQTGWGYTPFRQFRFPTCRYILTKSVGRFDDESDEDCDDLTNVYCDVERSDDDKFAVFNSCRGVRKDTPGIEYQGAAFNRSRFDPNETDLGSFDVEFDLHAPEKVMIGQPVVIPVLVKNKSNEDRNIQTNICTRSSYYTGHVGSYLKKSATQIVLGPNEEEKIRLTLDPADYESKLVDMEFVKIILTGFVKETEQSYVDEFDFRFKKPWINIEVDEAKLDKESRATFSFRNPLDVPLTDCFFTYEMSGSVRPRTIRIGREVRPKGVFSYTHSFVPRKDGKRRMVACFVSKQLSDVVGQRSVMVQS